MYLSKTIIVLSVGLALSAVAAEPMATTEAAAVPAGSAPKLSEPEVAQILLNANEAEVEQGRLARMRGDKKEVKDFAKMMVDKHKDADKKIN